jgi:hypothetical protein
MTICLQLHKKELIMKLAAALKMSPKILEKELKPILPGLCKSRIMGYIIIHNYVVAKEK